MGNQKKQLQMVAGQKYRGYGLLNEYGEFEFIPEDKGAREGVIKKVTIGNGYEVSTTKKYILFRIKIERSGDMVTRLSELLKKVDNLIKVIKEYEF